VTIFAGFAVLGSESVSFESRRLRTAATSWWRSATVSLVHVTNRK